ncbi:glycosyltransferase [Paraburkholderia sp. C35]|uniref:glycosyltransferase family 2 protein n=1 Tax=Paraburkholderia sp. C35 TaxID=2126993 RepID=UPI000D692A4E|nr:glycosyltransferase [Paraburkholderia sp. C35]
MNARVAVIIPTRNRRALLARALESVFRQTYRDLVAVVVNDGSTDDTRTFLDQMARQEPRLIVHHMAPSTGAPSARNYAIANTDAEFVTGLDDDDEFLPDRIEFLIRSWNASGNDRDLISCLFTESVMTDGVHASVTVDRKDIVSYRDLFTHNFIGNQIFCPRERVLSVGGYDPALPAWQDLEMFMRLVRRYGPARRVHAPTYVCHVDRRPDRISANAESLLRAFELIAG